MDSHEQMLLAQAIGELKGLMTSLNQTVAEHLRRDDERFDRQEESHSERLVRQEELQIDRFKELWDKFDEIKDQRGQDIAAATHAERDATKWKWTVVWTLAGTIGGSVATAVIKQVISGSPG